MKKLLFDELKRTVAQELYRVLQELWPPSEATPLALDVETLYQGLISPPQKEMGHLAWGTFPLSKVLRLPPPAIAQKVAESLQDPSLGIDKKGFVKIQGVGPYVNFFFSGALLSQTILEPLLSGAYFQQKLLSSPPKTMVEYSQPNTHKELHVGHMRNACLGDAVVRCLRYAGYEVISTTFPGDVGTHVAKALWYLKFHNQDPIPAEHRGEWLGKIYSKAHLFLEDREGTPAEAEDRAQLSKILKQIESQEGEFFELWKETRRWSIDLMNEVYAWCGITFDHWYWESDVDSDSVKTIKQYFAEGKLIESEGAIGMDLTHENLGFCVLLKSDGNGLYATKDIELARRKFVEHQIEQSIYVVDMRQALHFKQVFATLKHLGFQNADQCFHLQYNFVELPDGAMSSRKGNIVPLTQLVHQMEQHVKDHYLARYHGEWTTEEVESTAQKVAQGAIKYGMVKMDPNKKIVFQMEEWLKLDGDSGPYIQYAYARIQSILRKLDETAPMISESMASKPTASKAAPSGQALHHPVELQLALLLGQLNSVIVQAVENFRPNVLCHYLLEVAKQFSQFYHECPISQAPHEELKLSRRCLAEATGRVLKLGLSLLGIPVPERM